MLWRGALTFQHLRIQLKRYTSFISILQNDVNEIANIIDEDAVCRYLVVTALEKHYVTTVMHLQHKTGSTGEDGALAKGILKQWLSERFVKHLYFLLDVMKILSELSKSFQHDKLCITDIVAKLDTTVIMLEEWKLQRGGHYRKFMESYSEKTAVFICGKDKGHQLKLTHAGNMLDQQFDTFLTEVLTYLKSRFGNLQEKPCSLFRILDQREMPQTVAAYGHNEIVPSFSTLGTSLLRKRRKVSLISDRCCVPDSADKGQTIQLMYLQTF